jgi:serine/threonine-protein kinase
MEPAEDIDVDLVGIAPPERVGRYRVGAELARGGMALVCLASLEEGSDEVVALKLVHPHLIDDSDFVEMFLDEARISTRIRHPNVCRVTDYGEADDTLFLAMELLRGTPLTKLNRRVRQNPDVLKDPRWARVAASIMSDVCAGLHAAHELLDDTNTPLHVVHRDVSPHNVFVCWDGVSKILDFGVAASEHRLHMTRAGTVKGKFEYIAPEQVQSKKVDRRADVWAVGTVLWELLAGKALFRGPNHAQTIARVLAASVPPIEGAPRELQEIIARAVRLDVNERIGTAGEIGEALDSWLGDVGKTEVATVIAELMPGAEQAEAMLIEQHMRPGHVPRAPIERASSISHVRVSRPSPIPFIVGALLLVIVAVLAWTVVRYVRSAADSAPSAIAPSE